MVLVPPSNRSAFMHKSSVAVQVCVSTVPVVSAIRPFLK